MNVIMACGQKQDYFVENAIHFGLFLVFNCILSLMSFVQLLQRQ